MSSPSYTAELADLQSRVAAHLSSLERDDPRSDAAQLKRFLTAREGDVDKAFEMWQRWYEWRIEAGVDNLYYDDIQDEYAWGKSFWHGRDRSGLRCIVSLPRYHFPPVTKPEGVVSYGVYLMEQASRLFRGAPRDVLREGGEAAAVMKDFDMHEQPPVPPHLQPAAAAAAATSSAPEAAAAGAGADTLPEGSTEGAVEQVCVIYDRRGVVGANFDRTLFATGRKMTALMQDSYAEFLGRVYVVNVSTMFWMLYKAISPLLSQKTKDKMIVLRNVEDLKKYFRSDQLLVQHGGTSGYTFPHKRPFADSGLPDLRGTPDCPLIDDDRFLDEDAPDITPFRTLVAKAGAVEEGTYPVRFALPRTPPGWYAAAHGADSSSKAGVMRVAVYLHSESGELPDVSVYWEPTDCSCHDSDSTDTSSAPSSPPPGAEPCSHHPPTAADISLAAAASEAASEEAAVEGLRSPSDDVSADPAALAAADAAAGYCSPLYAPCPWQLKWSGQLRDPSFAPAKDCDPLPTAPGKRSLVWTTGDAAPVPAAVAQLGKGAAKPGCPLQDGETALVPFAVAGPGKVVVELGNKASWVRSKTLRVHVRTDGELWR